MSKREPDEDHEAALSPSIEPQGAKKTKRSSSSVDGSKRKAFLVRQLQSEEFLDEETGKLSGCFWIPGRFKLKLKGELWAKFGTNPQDMPLYLLEALYDEKHNIRELPEMELVHQQLGKQDSFIIEKFFTSGAILIATTTCESEIAFPCQARVVKGQGNAYCMLGPIFETAQYYTPSEIPRGLFKEHVLDFVQQTGDGRQFRTGDCIKYNSALVPVADISWRVNDLSRRGDKPGAMHSVWVEAGGFAFPTAHAFLVHTGMGFRAKNGIMGIMNGVGRLSDENGKKVEVYGCTGYHGLVSDDIMNALVPNGLEMDKNHVLQTNMLQCVNQEVPFDMITHLYYVCALAEQSASNSGTPDKGMVGTKFVVGHLNVAFADYVRAARFASSLDDSPPHPISQAVELHGVRALLGKEVFESIAQSRNIFNGFVPSNQVNLLRALFEDGLLLMAATRPEESIQARNTFVLEFPVHDAIALVWSLTDEIFRKVHYDKNTITVTFDAGLEPSGDVQTERHDEWVKNTWEATVPLWGRNAQRTIMPGLGGNVLVIGQLRMQFVLLPRELVVVKVAYSELLTPGGTLEVWSNRTSSGSKHEFNRTYKDTKHCKHCLRRVSRIPFTNGCTCGQMDD